ncbi:MAG: hypothetical protein IKJ30_05205 [Bacilli bacterium]|nr:hypothetical protein [Bacilli bacterium]
MKTVEEKLWDKLYKLADKKEIDRDAMNRLVNYYINFNKWNETQALNYAINLYYNGCIDMILALK